MKKMNSLFSFLMVILLFISLSLNFRFLNSWFQFGNHNPYDLLVSSGITKQIGLNESIIKENSKTVVALHYPKFGHPVLDQQVNLIISKELNEFQYAYQSTTSKSPEYRSQIYSDYQTYYTNHRFVGIVFMFEISSPNLAHPIKYSKVLNYDLVKNKDVDLNDIFLDSVYSTLSTYTLQYLSDRPEYKDELSTIDLLTLNHSKSNIYSKMVIGNNGLRLYIDAGQVLSYSKGDITLEVPYETLENDLRISINPSRIDNYYNKPKKPDSRVIDVNKPMVALTFDDGPTANTPLILEVLKRNNAVATFFVVGSRINSYPNTIQDIIASGSEIGNHTWSHRMMTKLNDNELIEEIVLTNNAIYALTNTTPTYVRPPYGMVNGLILKKFPHISFAMWSVDTLDWKHKNGELTLAEIENSVYDGAIILMHDLVSSTAASMEDIVQLLTQKGYQLVTVSEMCEYRNQTHQKFRDCKP